MRTRSPIALSFISSLALLSAAERAHADETSPPPKPPALCRRAPEKKAVRSERVLQRWPDNTIKAQQITYVDRSTRYIYWHRNGQRKLESYHRVILVDGQPRRRRHVKDGTEKRWHDNGQLFVCAVYDKGKKTGTWIYYDRQGEPTASFRYVDDKQVEHLTHSRVFGWRHAAR